MSQTEKFGKAHEITSKMAETLSEMSMPVFTTYMNAFKQAAQFIEQNKIFAVFESAGAHDDNNVEPYVAEAENNLDLVQMEQVQNGERDKILIYLYNFLICEN